MAKNTSFKDKKADELEKLLADSRENLRKARFAAAGSRPADSSVARKHRKDIARILTEMTAQASASA